MVGDGDGWKEKMLSRFLADQGGQQGVFFYSGTRM
jgi:hypothetical protein